MGVAVEGALVPGLRRNRAIRPGSRRLCAVRRAARRSSRSARQASRARARDRAGEGAERRCSIQRRKTPAKTRRASGWASSWKTGSMRASTGRRRSSCAQKAWMVPMKARSRLRAASARRCLHGGIEFAGAAAFQLVADAQFHVAGGGVGEGDGHDGFHRRAGGDDFDDAVHQGGGLAGAGGGFHHPTAVEIGDAESCGGLRVWRSARQSGRDRKGARHAPHFQPRSSFKPSTRLAIFPSRAPLHRGRRRAGTRSSCSRLRAGRRGGCR